LIVWMCGICIGSFLSFFIQSAPLFLRTQNTMTDRFMKSLSFSAGHDINEN